jgi:hypothetical protein
MKFYKRLSLDPHNPTTNMFALEANGEFITTSTNSIQLPRGQKVSRPSDVISGQIRYNTDSNWIEARIGLVWQRVRMVTPATIAVQQLGNGNNSVSVFGPLNPDYSASYSAGPANVMIYIDNVYQIPGVNYSIGGASTVTTTLSRVAPVSTSTLWLTTMTNIIPGLVVSGNSYIVAGTTVTNVSTNSNSVQISNPTAGAISSGTALTFNFNSSGSYILFAGTVPYKPVVAILGMDGNFPPAV